MLEVRSLVKPRKYLRSDRLEENSRHTRMSRVHSAKAQYGSELNTSERKLFTSPLRHARFCGIVRVTSDKSTDPEYSELWLYYGFAAGVCPLRFLPEVLCFKGNLEGFLRFGRWSQQS